MKHTAVIKPHPSADGVFVIDVHQSLNTVMSRFAPARLDQRAHGWVCPDEHEDAFATFARFNDIAVTDARGQQRRVVPTHERPQMPECRRCAQPAKADCEPVFCPSCGERWESILPREIVGNEPVHITECLACGHKNRGGRFPHCAKCGADLRDQAVDPEDEGYDPMAEVRRNAQATLAMLRGDPDRLGAIEPMHLGQVIRPVEPYAPPWDTATGRRIEDVPLPDPDSDDQ